MKKVVSNAGGLTSTVVYFYDEWEIVETRNGSNAVVQQFIHGTQYIDELVMVRVKDKGDLYVHQDANWNVIGLTDLGRRVVERYVYTPYGELLVNQETSFGDRDGDNDVDAADKGTVGVTCTGTVSGSCRILDVDFDGDYDSTDATLFNALPQGLARRPGRAFSGVSQPFAHLGRLFDAEIGSLRNISRVYSPMNRRNLQRDRQNVGPQPLRKRFPFANLYLFAGAHPTTFSVTCREESFYCVFVDRTSWWLTGCCKMCDVVCSGEHQVFCQCETHNYNASCCYTIECCDGQFDDPRSNCWSYDCEASFPCTFGECPCVNDECCPSLCWR